MRQVCSECLGIDMGRHGSGEPDGYGDERECGPPMTVSEIVDLVESQRQEIARLQATIRRQSETCLIDTRQIDQQAREIAQWKAAALGSGPEAVDRIIAVMQATDMKERYRQAQEIARLREALEELVAVVDGAVVDGASGELDSFTTQEARAALEPEATQSAGPEET